MCFHSQSKIAIYMCPFFCRLSSNNSRVPPRVWLPALRTFQALLAVMANIVIQHRRFLPKLYWQTLSKLKKYFVKLQYIVLTRKIANNFHFRRVNRLPARATRVRLPALRTFKALLTVMENIKNISLNYRIYSCYFLF